MSKSNELPEGVVLTRTTELFDNDSVPAGLRRAHRVADRVWGRLVVHTGSVRFVWEDSLDDVLKVEAGGAVVIPPARMHHVEFDGPATFVVEFYRQPTESSGGLESTGLA